MSTYVYRKFSNGVYTVGHYSPTGQFIPETDWKELWRAASRVNFLNGGRGYNPYDDVKESAAAITIEAE
jgi:hypothetical protein